MASTGSKHVCVFGIRVVGLASSRPKIANLAFCKNLLASIFLEIINLLAFFQSIEVLYNKSNFFFI